MDQQRQPAGRSRTLTLEGLTSGAKDIYIQTSINSETADYTVNLLTLGPTS